MHARKRTAGLSGKKQVSNHEPMRIAEGSSPDVQPCRTSLQHQTHVGIEALSLGWRCRAATATTPPSKQMSSSVAEAFPTDWAAVVSACSPFSLRVEDWRECAHLRRKSCSQVIVTSGNVCFYPRPGLSSSRRQQRPSCVLGQQPSCETRARSQGGAQLNWGISSDRRAYRHRPQS